MIQKKDRSNGDGYIEVWQLNRSGPSKQVLCPASAAVGILAPTKNCPIPTGFAGLLVAVQALPGNRLMVAQSGRITTWDAATMRRIGSVPGPRFTGGFAAAALSPDGKTLAYGLGDGTVRFFDIASGKTILGEGAHSGEVDRMTFSPDSRVAVSTGDDGLAIIWDPKTGKVLERLTGHASRVFAADFSPDSETLYTPGIDGAILQYDLGTSRRFGRPFSVGVGPAARGHPQRAPAPRRRLPTGERWRRASSNRT